MINFENKLNDKYKVKKPYLGVKRAFDVVFAALLTIPTLPLTLVFAILVKLETEGPAFYKQERVGLMGQPIYITKIRSMVNDAEAKSGAIWAGKNDSRITKVGKFIRNTRIDELPQLINVLKGEMSFIGPRPERPIMTQQFSEEIAGFEQRLLIKPGLSGLAQVRGGYEATPSEKLLDDMEYIDHVSLKLDLYIALQTVVVVFTGRGAR